MMWSSIETLKENLNRIALEIHEDDDDDGPQLSISSNSGVSLDNSVVSPANRRISRNFSPSISPTQHNHHSPIANGLDSAYKSEVLSSLYLFVKSELEVLFNYEYGWIPMHSGFRAFQACFFLFS